MKRIVSLIAIISCVAFAFDASAQMSKSELKTWKKRLKKLEPEQYKTLIEENKSLKSQVSSLKNELGGVDDKIAEKDEQIGQYETQISELRSQLTAAKNAQPKQPTRSTASSGSSIDDSQGVVFKVQIGAFTNKDLTKYLEASDNFSGETEGDLKKYSLGVFKDYWEADTFKKYLREMGVKDAWIVSYKDGQRVPIKDVLEGVSKKS